MIERETALLKARQPLDIADLQPDKARLANAYAKLIETAAQSALMLDRVPAARISSLKDAMTTLGERLAENAASLEAAKKVSEELIHEVAEQAATQKPQATVYGASASIVRPADRSPAALSLDQTI